MAEYIYSYELGDDSHDGHCITETGKIKVNHPNANLKNALDAFNKATGCHWEEWCEEYEDPYIHGDDAKKFCEYCGLNEEDELDEDGNIFVDGEDGYIGILMEICKVTIPDLEWSFYNEPDDGQAFFNGRGYGLFSC